MRSGNAPPSPRGGPRRVVVDLFKLRTLHCGLGQFCLHLGRALAEQPDRGVRSLFHLRASDRRLIDAPMSDCVPAAAWRKERVFRRLRPLRWLTPHGPDGDLWHATDQFCKHLPADPTTPLVLTIHDLNFLREKDSSRAAGCLAALQRKVDRAAVVTTISEFVAGEVRERLRLGGKPLRVVYNGAVRDRPRGDARPPFLPDGPFLFTIGTVLPKKNFHALIPLVARTPGLRLVIAGPDHHEYARLVRDEAAAAGVADRVLVPGAISDEHRQWLYAHCEAFVFPSLTEGFGLPVIEAMHHGRPVFVARRTSLPEVAGPHAFYWESDDPDHMTRVYREGMRHAASDPLLGDRLRRHADRFDWDRTARDYLAVYREALGLPTSPGAEPEAPVAAA